MYSDKMTHQTAVFGSLSLFVETFEVFVNGSSFLPRSDDRQWLVGIDSQERDYIGMPELTPQEDFCAISLCGVLVTMRSTRSPSVTHFTNYGHLSGRLREDNFDRHRLIVIGSFIDNPVSSTGYMRSVVVAYHSLEL